jgi:hypothetical protein
MSLGDAYITTERAEELAARIADVAVWSAAGEAVQEAALLQASDEIDTLSFAGMPYGDWTSGVAGAQARAFPRFVPDDAAQWPPPKRSASGRTWDWDDEAGEAVVPEVVELAVFLQALAILRGGRERLRDQQSGVASQSAGGVSESYDTGRRPQIVCLEAMALLNRYLLKSGRVI